MYYRENEIRVTSSSNSVGETDFDLTSFLPCSVELILPFSHTPMGGLLISSCLFFGWLQEPIEILLCICRSTSCTKPSLLLALTFSRQCRARRSPSITQHFVSLKLVLSFVVLRGSCNKNFRLLLQILFETRDHCTPFSQAAFALSLCFPKYLPSLPLAW